AAALLLSKGQGEGSVDVALFGQMMAKPVALVTVAVLLTIFAVFPGLPFLPFILGAGAFGYAAWRAHMAETERLAKAAAPAKPVEKPKASTLGDVLDLDEIHVELDQSLTALLAGTQETFDRRIEKLRKFVIQRYGFVMPPVRVTDAGLGAGQYRISLQGTVVAADTLKLNHSLALVKPGEHADIEGVTTTEPVYGAEARWVSPSHAETLADRGVTTIEPVEVLATHLLESIQNGFEKLMSRRALREALDAFTDLSDELRADANKKLLDEFLPEKVSYDTLQWVMRGLLAEKISVRNIPLILEAIVEHQGRHPHVEDLVEAVRRTISFQFIENYQAGDGTLPLVQLAPKWDAIFKARFEGSGEEAPTGSLSAEEFKSLGDEVQEALNKAAISGAYAAIAVASKRRRFVRDVLKSRGIKNPVIAFEEIVPGSRPSMLAVA
ncbi:MAG: FHIPEP family type III secretion protein, partial [Pseudomonadota bacterium]